VKPSPAPPRRPPPPASQPVRPKAPPPQAYDDFEIDEFDVDDTGEYGIAPTAGAPPARSPGGLPPVSVPRAPTLAQTRLLNQRTASIDSAQYEATESDDELPETGSLVAMFRAPAIRSPTDPLRFLYLTLALSIVPLAFSLMGADGSIEDRFARTHQNHPEAFPGSLENGFDLEDVLAKLPDHRLDGAHLSRKSWMHWMYAFASAGAFLAVAIYLFEMGTASPRQLLGVGAATATFGIVSLLLVQLAASLTSGFVLRGNIAITIVFYILKFIGFSYQCATDPRNGFLLSFFGYTFGVGLCEELTKAMPVLLRMRSPRRIDWRGACVWGLASGVGFGVAEGIMYSSDYYNGIHTGGIYFVRFISCVALHAVWSAAVGISLWHKRSALADDLDWKELVGIVFIALAGPMILHGLYDTMLKREMSLWALATALASFAWLAGLIEWTRRQEAYEEELEHAPELRSIR
jgi:RsiW-degrading membrane proteinase PrsW (M82 family)